MRGLGQRTKTALILAGFCRLALLQAVDFPDPIPIIDPGRPAEAARQNGQFLPYSGGSFEYDYALMHHSDEELFMLRTDFYAALFQQNGFALGFRFTPLLLAGPVQPSETAASVAEFWLNAVQFEYGLHASCRLSGDWRLLGEYSRMSLHPLRSGFAETAYDILKLGVAPPPLFPGPFRIEAFLRAGYHGLFRFWQSDLYPYRVRYSIAPRIRLEHMQGKGLFADVEPNLLLLRPEGVGYEIFSELGVRIPSGGGVLEIYLRTRLSDDSELLAAAKSPAALAGLGMRISPSP